MDLQPAISSPVHHVVLILLDNLLQAATCIAASPFRALGLFDGKEAVQSESVRLKSVQPQG